MKKSKRLVFFGNERLATATTTSVPVLRALITAGYEVTAVLASHADPISRQKRDLEIGPVAQAHGIPVILPGEKISLADKVRRHSAEVAVLVAYGRIIPQSVIDLFPKGIINLHPSLLPELRGPTPIETAILKGQTGTGVSLMRIVAAMDAGPVYAQGHLKLDGSESKQILVDKLGNLGAKLLLTELPGILDGSRKPTPQEDRPATYTKLIKKSDGVVDWTKPAEVIEREVRAYLGWPKSQAKLKNFDVIITKVRVAKSEGDGSLVQKCGEGWLEILQLIAPSGRLVSGQEFLRGYSKD